MKVLVSGASVGGPVLAYWLRERGFEVTLVERAPAPRLGGQAVDIRGAALDRGGSDGHPGAGHRPEDDHARHVDGRR